MRKERGKDQGTNKRERKNKKCDDANYLRLLLDSSDSSLGSRGGLGLGDSLSSGLLLDLF